MAKDLLDMTFQAAVLALDEAEVIEILRFGRSRRLLIGTTDETYQHVILAKPAN